MSKRKLTAHNPSGESWPAELRVDRKEVIARALYEAWVEEDFAQDYAGWEDLQDKQTWLDRAQAVLDALDKAGW